MIDNNWCVCPNCNKVNSPKIITGELPKKIMRVTGIVTSALPKEYYLIVCNQCYKPLLR
jgi:hypothetical protein